MKDNLAVDGLPNDPEEFANHIMNNRMKFTSWGLCCYLTYFLVEKEISIKKLGKYFTGDYWKNNEIIGND